MTPKAAKPAAARAKRRRATSPSTPPSRRATGSTIPLISTFFWLAPKVSIDQRTMPPGRVVDEHVGDADDERRHVGEQPGDQLGRCRARPRRRAPRRLRPQRAGGHARNGRAPCPRASRRRSRVGVALRRPDVPGVLAGPAWRRSRSSRAGPVVRSKRVVKIAPSSPSCSSSSCSAARTDRPRAA